MRIQDKQRVKSRLSPGGSAAKASPGVFADNDFQDVMNKQHTPDWKGDLDRLLKQLDELGQRLIKSFSVYDLKAYKETLGGFLKETLGRTYKIKEETTWSKKGKTKVYQIIQKINGELEEMSVLVISKQRDQMKLLAKLDQIRGLMIDLYS